MPRIRRHFLRLSDCLTSFTLLFLTLPLFLMVHASTLSAILYSAAAAGNLISASSSSSAHEFSDLNFSASDALLVAHLPFLQLLRVHLLVLTIRLVLWCFLLSFRGGRLWPSTREESRQDKFSHSSCQVLFCLSRSQHAPSANSETLGSITYCSATRVRISNTHLWRFWRCWSRHKCSTGSFAWVRGVVSALFESCCWNEYIGIRSDGFQ